MTAFHASEADMCHIIILNRASSTGLLQCLTKVELTSVWRRVAMMFALVSWYLGIWMDMICVAFWKITVLCCPLTCHFSGKSIWYFSRLRETAEGTAFEVCRKPLNWNQYLTPGIPERMKLVQQLRRSQAITPMKQWGNRFEALVWKFDTVHYDTMYQNIPGISSQSFVQFLLMQRIQNVKFGPSLSFSPPFYWTSEVQTNQMQSLPPTNFWTLTPCRGIFAHGVSSASRSNWKASESRVLAIDQFDVPVYIQKISITYI